MPRNNLKRLKLLPKLSALSLGSTYHSSRGLDITGLIRWVAMCFCYVFFLAVSSRIMFEFSCAIVIALCSANAVISGGFKVELLP